jgi:hypothetical protein
MESASWRRYRRHLIIARRTFLGFRRYDIWKHGRRIETFRDVVDAELHIDSIVEGRRDDQEQS